MNIELLRKIQQSILEHPDRFNMNHWVSLNLDGNGCGTTACIAGWACVLERKTQFGKAIRTVFNQHGYDISLTARNHLGLTLAQGQRLFHVANWPEAYCTKHRQLQCVFYESKDASCRAKARARLARLAAKRIDLFIESKGAQ